MELIVVGAGIAGSALTRCARAAGHTVTLVSEAAPDSLAAAAILRKGYHRKHPGELEALERSLALYAEWGVPIHQGGAVSNYRTPGRAPRADDDWYLVDPAAPLVEPDLTGHATPAGPFSVVLKGRTLDADAVAWCVGVNGGASGVTYGVTFLHDDPAVLAEPSALRLHHYAPYKTIAAGYAGGQVRLGSSSANTPDKAREQGHKMLQAAYEQKIITTLGGWRVIAGRRCKSAEDIGPGASHHRLAGLHRTGYALAPALAQDLLHRIVA